MTKHINIDTNVVGEIILGDCLEVMRGFADNQFDLVLTDPPYGITKEKWDTLMGQEYIDEIMRVSKNQIIFGGNYYKLPPNGNWIIWHKRPFLKTTHPFEMAWSSFRWRPNAEDTRLYEYTLAGNVEGWHGDKLKPNYSKGKNVHSTQKPVVLFKKIILDFTEDNHTILDPFAGSGTTLLAAHNLNRNYIGIEINPDYVKIAQDRLKQELLL